MSYYDGKAPEHMGSALEGFLVEDPVVQLQILWQGFDPHSG